MCAIYATIQDAHNKQRGVLWAAFVLLTVTLMLYWPATKYGFVVVDDDQYVTENPWVTQGLSLSGLKWAFTATYAANWHPLTWISHMLDYSIYGLFAGGHHLTNILIHALNSVLVFLLLRRWTGSMWRSALVAAFFAWHPLRIESVAWVAERKDVLSTLFMLLTLLAYGQYARQPTASKYTLTLGLFALGLMAKPMVVTLPFLLLLLDYWPLGRLRPAREFPDHSTAAKAYTRLVAEKLPFFGLSAALCVITLVAQRAGGALKTLEEIPFTLRLFNSLASYARYLDKTFWPQNLCVYYPMPQEPPILLGITAAIMLAVVSYAAFRWRKDRPWLFVGWFWFVGTLVPVIGLVQVGNQAMADRYTYIPSIGLFIMLIWCLACLLRRYRPGNLVGTTLAVFTLACCLLLTRTQLGYWHDSITLMSRAVSVTRQNAFAHSNLGVALANAGRMEDAVAHYQEALRIKPTYPKAHYNLGLALSALGRLDEAIHHFGKTLELDPNSELAHNNLGALLAQQGQYDLAIEHFTMAIRLNPLFPKPYLNCGYALQKLGHAGPAVTNYTKALELEPDWPEALDRLAFLLAACPQQPWHNPTAAVGLAERAVRISGYEWPGFIATLAFAHAAAGNFSNAVSMAELGQKKTRENDMTKLAEQLERDLEFYRAGQVPPKDFRNPH